MNKDFVIQFKIKNGRIATKMTSKNLQVQEKLGLLEIAKQQILDEIKKTKRDIFKGVKEDE
ncbi:hypothetical protein CL616_04745 [archaeon]|mgnify:CR=1 FL=1|nr:hypothetical protein [archaeon]|tara:strand:- start:1291 stop:1473 length:183 start_codon:yes stop_codon:yes gene_type:complete